MYKVNHDYINLKHIVFEMAPRENTYTVQRSSPHGGDGH